MLHYLSDYTLHHLQYIQKLDILITSPVTISIHFHVLFPVIRNIIPRISNIALIHIKTYSAKIIQTVQTVANTQ